MFKYSASRNTFYEQGLPIPINNFLEYYSNSGMLLGITAPIENVNRMLDLDAKRYCRKNLSKILIGLVVFIGFLTLFGKDKYISLVAYTLLVVVSSAALGIVKFNIEKRKLKNID